MLRYIEDLNLATPVRLVYCVCTAADIIFQNELARLATALPNFKYEVCLSQPDPTWEGHTGHLTEEFVSRHVSDPFSLSFFLSSSCGDLEVLQHHLPPLACCKAVKG